MTILKEAPGRPRVFIETYGCSFNVSDGEVMAALLERDGFDVAPSADEADVVVVNSCTVKDQTWRELKKRVGALQAAPATGAADAPAPSPATVILAGCAPRVPEQSAHFSDISQLGPNNLADLPEVVRRTLAGERLVRTDVRHDTERLTLPSRRRNPRVEIVPISKGCLGSCTFCQTVLARGRLRSFPMEQILEKIRTAVAEGVTQVWLTSQDCGAYGLDIGVNLPELMNRVAELPGDFTVRIGMANPDLIWLYYKDFARALAHPRFYQFAHIPLQAGSDKVLADMRRMYTVEQFRVICEELRLVLPDITIATDIIVGFPTESDADFEQTLSIICETAIPVVNRSRFSPRAGTPAARLKGLPSKVVSGRSKQLYETACDIAFADLEKWSGWRGSVLVEEQLTGRGKVLARNFNYKPVVLPALGASRALVQISTRERFHLEGDVVIAG